MVMHSSHMYQVLRGVTPTFLQIVFSDPTLWASTDCNSTAIPLAKVLSSPRHEVAYFTLVDSTCAMAFGLPQQVEYDTTLDHFLMCPTPYECAYSAPTEFQIILAEINASRDKSLTARNWGDIEYELVTWQARPSSYYSSWESWMVVAWLAVQESWRHALLVYFYMVSRVPGLATFNYLTG